MACACGGLLADERLSVSDESTRRLLDALEELPPIKQMPDVVLAILDRVEAQADAAAELKREVPYRRSKALVAVSRKETDAAKKEAIYDRAEKDIDTFLASKPPVDAAISASMQKANLLVDRGRGKVEQAKRPGVDAKPLLAEALGFFNEAIKAIEGKPRGEKDPITDVTNAEDAVLKSLREVGDELKKLGVGPASEKDGNGEGKEQRQQRKPAPRADPKLVEALEEERDALRGRLLQVRMMVAGVYFEKSRAAEPKSKAWTDALTTSTKKYAELSEKYPTLAAGLYARYFQGRNYAELAVADPKKYEEAVTTLAELCDLEGVPDLRAKAINTTLQCWLANDKETKFADFSDTMLKSALVPASPEQLDADFLGMKYRAAAILQKRAAGLAANERNKAAIYQRDAKKLALEVAKANQEFAKEARDLLGLLGKEVVGDAAGKASFELLMDEAKVTLATMEAKKVEAKQAANDEEAAKAALAAVAEARQKTIESLRAALPLATEEELLAVNQARNLLTFLLYDAKRFHDSATLGTFLAERYPNAKGSRQSAKIAIASWQQLQMQASPEWSQNARAQAVRVAGVIMRTWPEEPETIDAAMVAIAAAGAAHQPEQLLAIIDQLPREGPRRGEALLRAGTLLCRELQDARRAEESERPAVATLDAWRDKAIAALDEGLAAIPAGAAPTPVAVAAALARAQLAMESGDQEKVGRILEAKEYGPWAVVQGDDKQFTDGPLANGALSLALRYFIGADKLQEADQAMDRLEALAGEGEEASARLTAMYLVMGRDLQGQLVALSTDETAGSPEAQAKADKILGGFEKFLERVGNRDQKITSQMWVAATYLALGSGQGVGKVVSKERAGGYLGKAAELYEKLLAKGGEEIAKFESAIRLKSADIHRERGKWEEALVHLEWILGDPARQNFTNVQVQAAELLQAAGENADDAAQAADYLKQAIQGRKKGEAKIWGWAAMANRLARQAFAGNDEKALKGQELFFDARYNVAHCRFERAKLPGQERAKLLDMATNDIAVTFKLYPGLGGEAMKKRFDDLLRQIQEARGDEVKGLAAMEEGNEEANEEAAAQAGE